jgi:hypothetical protein
MKYKIILALAVLFAIQSSSAIVVANPAPVINNMHNTQMSDSEFATLVSSELVSMGYDVVDSGGDCFIAFDGTAVQTSCVLLKNNNNICMVTYNGPDVGNIDSNGVQVHYIHGAAYSIKFSNYYKVEKMVFFNNASIEKIGCRYGEFQWSQLKIVAIVALAIIVLVVIWLAA